MLDKDISRQTVSGNSLAISSKRDVNLNLGLTAADVISICTVLLENNFPKLQQIAMEKSRESVQEYGEILFNRLAEKFNEQIEYKLKEPDIQSAINETVLMAAKKIEKCDKKMLSELIIMKIASPTDEDDVIMDDAISLIKYLTLNQINFICLLYYLRFISMTGIGNIPWEDYDESNLPNGLDIESVRKHCSEHYFFHYEQRINAFFFREDTRPISIGYLRTKGIIVYDKKYTKKMSELICSRIPSFENDEYKDKTINDNLPNLHKLINKFGINNLDEIDEMVLTDTGMVIGKALLSTKLEIIEI